MKKSNIKIILVLLSLMFILMNTGCKPKKFELEFITNGGNNIEAVMIKNKTDYTLPTPSREGYMFEGWYTNSQFTGNVVTTVTISENTKVYAKWKELCKITLNLNGGTCNTTIVYGQEGESVVSLLRGIVPSKSGVEFGGWFIGEVEVNENTKLTMSGLTVNAKYKAQYTVEIYKQKLNSDDYELEIVTDTAYVGKEISSDVPCTGFTLVNKQDSNSTITVSDNSSNNVMRVYYNRNSYNVSFNSNYPDDSLTNETTTVNAIYGEKINLPTVEYECMGYYLLGWSTAKDGKVLYPAHYIENLPFNKDGDIQFDPVKINVEGDVTLYAIWNKGYTDMFGGKDYIFLEKEAEKVYLLRGNVYFVGDYYSDGTFIFYNDNDNLKGKLYDDMTFAYQDIARDEYSASLYKVGVGLDDNVKILFDELNGITYSVKDENGRNDLSYGTYVIDDEGYYITTFTEGSLAGKTLTIMFGTVTLDNVKTDAFQIRNDIEFELGNLVRFVVYKGELTYYTAAYNMVLTGFGTLAYNTGNGYYRYSYTYNPEKYEIAVKDSNGKTLFIGRIMTIDGKNGYMLYNETLDATFTGQNGNTLVLDGVSLAEYKDKDDNIIAFGNYETINSAFGGKIVTFSCADKKYVFLTNSHQEEAIVGDETVNQTIYEFTEKLEGYAEYYYKNIDGYFYAPLIVINDSADGFASIYGYTTSKTYELVLEGSYVYDDLTNLYIFTTEQSYDKEVISDIIDLKTVSSIVFGLESSATNYAVNYWHSVTVGDEKTSFDEDYTSETGLTLKLVAGLAIISNGENTLTGTYKTENELTTISTSGGSIYVELNEEDKTFELLQHAPFSSYVVMGDGTYSKKEFMTFDGKGNAKYVYYVLEMVGEGSDAKEEEVAYTIEGTIFKLDETTQNGQIIYQFESDKKTFKFIHLTLSSSTFVLPYYGEYYGTYRSNNGGSLYLDGYAYYACYTDKQGNEYAGIYSIVEQNVIRITSNDSYKLFDITDRTFTIRGEEYGTYIVMVNQGTTGLYVTLNGYGQAQVFKIEYNDENQSNEVSVDDLASYSSVDGLYTILYKENNQEVTLVGRLSTYTYSNTVFNTFVIENTKVVSLYLNEKDWSILKLDSIGNAVKIDKSGIEEHGTYMLITDSLLYYVNNDSTNANIFKYDIEKGRINEEKFTARGYYTEDLKSLLFSQYGFAIFNNETRYYYTMEGTNVLIYHQDSENPLANEYGFVVDNFGEFEEVKTYNGEKYYENDGYAITFSRKDETKDKYPVLYTSEPEEYAPIEELTFTPSGSDTFRVLGSVKIKDKNYQCTVIRELVDDKYEMYFTIGYYRFDFTAKFTGKDSTGKTDSKYEITNLTSMRSFYPYAYLDTYYMIYSFYGPNYANLYSNQLGMFSLCKTYGEDGTQLEDYIKIDFFEGSNAFDLNGNLLSVEKASYTDNNGLYTVTIEGTDGYTYKLYFEIKMHSAFGMYAYKIYALTRVENVIDGNYNLTVERIIITDNQSPAGTVYSLELSKDEEKLEYTERYKVDNSWYYVVRTKENDLITSTKYYKLDLVTKDDSALEEESKVVIPYESLKVTELDAKTYYNMEKNSYFDIVDNQITIIYLNKYGYLVKECNYDETTNSYTITLSSGTQYVITIDENQVATITKLEVVKPQE